MPAWVCAWRAPPGLRRSRWLKWTLLSSPGSCPLGAYWPSTTSTRRSQARLPTGAQACWVWTYTATVTTVTVTDQDSGPLRLPGDIVVVNDSIVRQPGRVPPPGAGEAVSDLQVASERYGIVLKRADHPDMPNSAIPFGAHSRPMPMRYQCELVVAWLRLVHAESLAPMRVMDWRGRNRRIGATCTAAKTHARLQGMPA